jgi:LmbE family N-acetylglucosaminyl deacetylase
MVEAVMFWNEPNNKSHWAFEIDPEWSTFAGMVKLAGAAVAAETSRVSRVLGGISPIDPSFIENMQCRGVLDEVDVVAVHGFPLDWNHWSIEEWPAKLREIQAVTDLPVWVSEVGVSSFGAEEVQEFGLRRTAELLNHRARRIHWYSLYDLPRAWPATTRHRETEGSAYYRHFYMGLVREDGTPKRAFKDFSEHTPGLGICQWFHFEDHRLDSAVKLLRQLGVKHLRTGLSWADSFRPNAESWFDRQMKALEEFEVTVTYCFTPEHLGIQPHHTSPPQHIEGYADFCAGMTRRYANGTAGAHPIIAPSTLASLSVPGRSNSLLERLCAPADSPEGLPATVMVIAHPDDEVIGAGARLPRLRQATFIHVTNGAPRGMHDAFRAGLTTRGDYAQARRRELEAALAVVGIEPHQARCLEVVDQEASLHLAELARRLAAELTELAPEIVITHPYEGGHPDHDAVAFAVHHACGLIKAEGATPPLIIEMACYHGRDGTLIPSEFIPREGCAIATQTLNASERALKRRLFGSYVTQRAMLRNFPVDHERFRIAPDYDFTGPPHDGKLFYEHFDWGMTGCRWRTLAREAVKKLQGAAPVPISGAPMQAAAV